MDIAIRDSNRFVLAILLFMQNVSANRPGICPDVRIGYDNKACPYIYEDFCNFSDCHTEWKTWISWHNLFNASNKVDNFYRDYGPVVDENCHLLTEVLTIHEEAVAAYAAKEKEVADYLHHLRTSNVCQGELSWERF